MFLTKIYTVDIYEVNHDKTTYENLIRYSLITLFIDFKIFMQDSS